MTLNKINHKPRLSTNFYLTVHLITKILTSKLFAVSKKKKKDFRLDYPQELISHLTINKPNKTLQ